MLGKIGDSTIWQGWIRVTGDTILGDNTTILSINGLEVPTKHLLQDTDNWTFVKMKKTLTKEYEQFQPFIASTDTTIIHIALPAYYKVDTSQKHLGIV